MKSSSTPKQHFAKNQSALAAALGVSRQCISYHTRQPGSPRHRPDGRFEIQPWREYLTAFGRVDVSEGETSPGPASFSDLADYGAVKGLERACTVLPLVLGEALEGRLPQREIAGLAACRT